MRRRLPKIVAHAFTLIELIVVMVVLAILASLAVYSLGSVTDRYQLNRAVETFEIFDARARRDAIAKHQALQARIDRRRGQFWIDYAGGRKSVSFRLPSRVQITKIRRGRQITSSGKLEIDINSCGQSPSYAVQLQRGESDLWLLVLGRSGQIIPLASEGEVHEILSLQ